MVKNSHVREEKRNKRNKIIIGVFITVIMIGSTLGFFIADNSNTNSLEYKADNGKKYVFEQSQLKLFTKIDGGVMTFYSHPLDAKELNVTDEAASLLKSAQMFILTFNPESKDIQYIEQTRFDLEKDIVKMNKYVITGVIKNTSSYPNLQVYTCLNSTVYAPVIEFISSNESEPFAFVKDSCIIFEGRKSDFLKFRDYVVYKFYDVI